MSERPEKPQNNPSQAQGSWHSPREASPWQPTEQATQPKVEWTVKALPDDMATAPEKRGDWHLPQEGDTIFSPADEITVSPTPTTGTSPVVIRPEDLLAEIVGQRRAQAAMRPEDMSPQRRKKEDETVAADAAESGDTLLVDEASSALPAVEDDDESLTMSEYVALASLAQGMNDPSKVNVADLSPAERALFNVASQYAAELPKEPAPDTGATVTLQDTSQQSASQAADYARQQLAQLQDSGTPQPSFTQAPTVPQYTPEQIELAQKFRETKRQVQVLRQMESQGQIARQELESRLQQFTILDQQGNWWMVGYDSDQWYRYNNTTGQWDLAEPPVPLDAGAVRTETGLGAVAPTVMEDSLPYLPDAGQVASPEEFSNYDGTQYSQAQQQYSQQYGIQDTPLPRPGQPTNDPNLTMVGRSVDRDYLESSEPTMQGMTYVDSQATMPSASVAYEEYAPLGDVISQPRPIATGLEDPNLNISSPDFEAQSERQQQSALFYVAVAGVGLFICGLLSFGIFAWYAYSQYDSIVSEWKDEIAALSGGEVDFQTARILDKDGNIIAEITGEQGARTLVSIEAGQVSPFFVHAIVASEDPRFYENPGFDIWAVGRAFLQNLTAGEVVSGASTITQQIVREKVIGSSVVNFDRKLTEVLVALEVANTYTKNQILDIYINEFFYGEQSYGVEAASEFYFGIPASELNAAQAATLVGILPSPSSANPVVAPIESFNNMRVVLNRMLEANCIQFQHGVWAESNTPFCFNEDTVVDGSQLITLDDTGKIRGGAIQVQIAQVETRRYEPRQSDILYPHFVYYVLGQLDAAYGRGAYIDRGFTVYTTLDPRLQTTSQDALVASVDGLRLNGAVTGAMIVMEPASGAIRAMVGSPDFNDVQNQGQNNNTLSLQQPGSAIKPVLYTAALMGGPNGYYTPSTILWDVPTSFPLNNGQNYTPTNFDNRTRGPIPMRYALQQSLNIPAVKTYAFLGGEAFVTTANAMGIDFDPNPEDEVTPTFGLATAIGATEVSLYDLTHAYATIANDGIYTPLYVVDRITESTPGGNQIDVDMTGTNLDHSTQLQVVSPQVAYLMQNILSDDTARSTALNDVGSSFAPNGPISGASLGLPNQNYVAAKTGTNNTIGGNPSRIWTVGFTNNYAVGVWVGTLNQGTAMTGSVSGLAGAAPAWNAVMRAALNGRDPGAFAVPTQVVQDTFCFYTGTLASESCPTRVRELYWQNQPPPNADQGFVQDLAIDSWTGLRANEWCNENVVTQTFANVSDPFATQWLNNTQQGRRILEILQLPANLPAAPTGACQQGAPLPTVRINFPQENTSLLDTVAITGQVSANDLNRWELQISEVGTDNFRAIMPASTTQMPVAGTTLFNWDTHTVQNGEYFLRLAAFSNTNGGYIFFNVRVRVQNIPPTATPQPTQAATSAPLPLDPLFPTATNDPFGNGN